MLDKPHLGSKDLVWWPMEGRGVFRQLGRCARRIFISSTIECKKTRAKTGQKKRASQIEGNDVSFSFSFSFFLSWWWLGLEGGGIARSLESGSVRWNNNQIFWTWPKIMRSWVYSWNLSNSNPKIYVSNLPRLIIFFFQVAPKYCVLLFTWV